MVQEILACESAEHRQILEKPSKIAATDAAVLISGPWLGKRVICSLHPSAQFAQQGSTLWLIAAHCLLTCSKLSCSAAIRGAFTGARPQSAGLAAAADGGTLFFDEVDSVYSEQSGSLLLRFLQEKKSGLFGGTERHGFGGRIHHCRVQYEPARRRGQWPFLYRTFQFLHLYTTRIDVSQYSSATISLHCSALKLGVQSKRVNSHLLCRLSRPLEATTANEVVRIDLIVNCITLIGPA